MADKTITILDENGGVVSGVLNFKKADNGYGYIHKNHSDDVDYGMQIRDFDEESNSAIFQISGELQQANLLLQKAGDASASKHTIYHTGNKPTAKDIGAVAKAGDTMTGTLTVENSSQPAIKLHNTGTDSTSVISGNADATYMTVYNTDGDANNYRALALIDSNGFNNIKEALRLIDKSNGTSTTYKIYGTHNKPTPEEIGAYSSSGGTIDGTITLNKYNNGYGTINKNHSASADYGMQFRDVSSDDKTATLIVSGATQKATLSLKPSASGTVSTYEIYHEGNKPTPSEIGAAAANTHYIKTYTSITQLGLTAGSETIGSIVSSLPINSRLVGAVGASSNTAIYPYDYGTLIVDKIDEYRTIFTFYKKENNAMWVGTYDANKATPWSGWSKIYNAEDKPTAEEILPGTFVGKMMAQYTAGSNLGESQLRNIYAGTASMTAGTTKLNPGYIYLQYK